MYVKTPVIGIPNWKWKKEVFKFSKQHFNKYDVEIKDFCHECNRHFELLDFFDDKEKDIKNSKYYIYQHNRKKNNDLDVIKKINQFQKLYISMKHNIEFGNGIAVVTDDGCRIDGSHRLSIAIHLGIKIASVNIVRYEDLFGTKKSNKIRKQVLTYRQEIYGFD